jgi:hypothetical protein
MSKLPALVPAPRVHLTRYRGVFAPNSHDREAIIMKPHDHEVKTEEGTLSPPDTKTNTRAAITSAQCLKRAFKLEWAVCEVGSGRAKVIACLTDAVTINKILNYFQQKQNGQIGLLPASRAPPIRVID